MENINIMDKTQNPMYDKFRTARNANCGLVNIETADYAQTIRIISVNADGNKGEYVVPKIQWDIVNGAVGINSSGIALVKELFESRGQKIPSNDPVMFLATLASKNENDSFRLPENSIIFILNAQNYITAPSVIQAVWNLRDVCKEIHCTLTLLSPTALQLPKELASDFFFIEDPLPNEAAIETIVRDMIDGSESQIDMPDEDQMAQIVNACLGLSDFCVEQNIALSYDPKNRCLDIEKMWQNKVALIKQQQGLVVSVSGERFSDIGGLDNIKNFLRRAIGNKRDYKGVIFIEEIEKAFAGSGAKGGYGDSSGVTQDQLGTLLTYMQDNDVLGILLIGPPGTSKSVLAKAAGTEINVPSIQLDLGACKGSLVGQSEANIRGALKTIKSITSGKAVFIASCNRADSIPPELRRRFAAIFFVDLPKSHEREQIWNIWKQKYNLDENDSLPEGMDNGWSGSEIRTCCSYANLLGYTLEEASQFVAPVSVTSREDIDIMRTAADGRYLSASEPGFYKKWDLEIQAAKPVAAKDDAPRTAGRRRMAATE